MDRRPSNSNHESNCPLQWVELVELSNFHIFLTHHVAVSIGNFIFIHGGIKIKNSLKPTNELYRVNLENNQIDNLTSIESPNLSQHAAVVFSNRYIVLIGGWNGHSRISDVTIYDSETQKWLKQPDIEGFPKGAGLSSHTASASLKSQSKFPEILIIGREGSTRIQRRYGNAYRLICNDHLSKFTYYKLSMNIDSRSGHCTSVIHSTLYIVGGRDDKILDIHKMKDLMPDKQSKIVSKLIGQFVDLDLKKCSLVGKGRFGRKGHCLVPGNNGFIVIGGSSFIEANLFADRTVFLYSISNPDDYYILGSIKNARTDGICVINDSYEAFYHGGIDANGKMASEFLKLQFVV